jgi:hypothetical protein
MSTQTPTDTGGSRWAVFESVESEAFPPIVDNHNDVCMYVCEIESEMIQHQSTHTCINCNLHMSYACNTEAYVCMKYELYARMYVCMYVLYV